MTLANLNKGEQALLAATTPQETKSVEIVAAAAKAWAHEQSDYETFVKAAHLYIMARRKTTELIAPHISVGRKGNNAVTILEDYGFTKMQWHRRVKELEIEPTAIDEYFDDCIARHWEPSLFGLLKHGNSSASREPKKCPNCGYQL